MMSTGTPQMVKALFFDDFSEGQTFVSPARTVTESDIGMFAGLTGDYNPLHTDAEFAAGTPFGQRIAHGLLGLSQSVGLFSRLGVIEGSILAFLEVNWKFVGPVVIGDTVRVTARVASTKQTSKPDRGVVVLEAELQNQRDETVQRGSWTFMMKRRG
jgi:acyl dehydratase